MNDSMAIRRSCEEGMYLLREGNVFWRVNKDGVVDCTAKGHSEALEFLTSLRQGRTPSRRLVQHYDLKDLST